MSRMSELPERLAQGVAERVVALVVDAIDVNALLAQVDLDALLARVDLEAVLARIDLEQLIARIDLAATMSTTAASAAEEGLAVLRRSALWGDDLAAHWAGRLIGHQ